MFSEPPSVSLASNPDFTGDLPSDFIWGVATSAYQIEGAAKSAGRGPSIWDDFCERSGTINGAESGAIACDHYHRWEEDLGLLGNLGVNAYRFSLSWSRILPEGMGRINSEGLDFYDRLVDGLLERKITPWATLFHWDLPSALQTRGGWSNPEIADWFANYTEIVSRRLGDRVRHWVTINEPSSFLGAGYVVGRHAPGLRLVPGEFLECLANVLRAHGRAVEILRSQVPDSVVGWALCGNVSIPATDSAADLAAAERDYFSVPPGSPWAVSLYSDPVYLGRFPESISSYGAEPPAISDVEWKLISQPLDYIGYNAYSGIRVAAGPDGPIHLPPSAGHPRGSLPWLRVEDETLYWVTRLNASRYGNRPLCFLENGICGHDWVSLNGSVSDAERGDFLFRYLGGINRAHRDGYQVSGYFYWTFLDNFEWAEGYDARFGLVHVDFRTLKRTPKSSFFAYRDLIRHHRATSTCLA